MFRRRQQERFTVRARRVLTLAQEEAERRKAYFIEPEHVLVGLLKEDGGVARKAFDRMALTLDEVQATINILIKSSEPKKEAWIDLAPETKTLLKKSVEEARRFGHNYIGTEHLLLGIMRMERCMVQKVIEKHRLTYEQVRQQVLEIIREHNEKNPMSTSAPSVPLPPSVAVAISADNIDSHNTYYQNYQSPFVRLLALFGLDSKKESET